MGFVSLGCPKNLVDSEVMMGLLQQAGAELVSGAEDADVIVVNTCSFIASAQQESVNTILEMAKHKSTGRARKLVVAGCLVERFRNEIRQNIPEVDAVVGTGELEGISQPLESLPPGPLILPSGFCNRAPKAMPAPSRTFLARELGRRHCRPAQLSVRRSYAPRAGHAAAHGVHQDRRRLRSSLHLLHHSATARPVPVAAF